MFLLASLNEVSIGKKAQLRKNTSLGIAEKITSFFEQCYIKLLGLNAQTLSQHAGQYQNLRSGLHVLLSALSTSFTVSLYIAKEPSLLFGSFTPHA
jgi:glycine cleavage system regulatory protein